MLIVTIVALHGRFADVGRLGGPPGLLPVLAAVAVNLVANGVLATTWRDVVALAGPRLGLRDAWWVWSASNLARYALSGAQVPGRAVLGRRYGLSGVVGGATVLVEVAWMAALEATAAIVTAPWWLGDAAGLRWVAWFGALPALALAVGLVSPRTLLRAAAWALALPLVRRVVGPRVAAGVDALDVRRVDGVRLTAWFAANFGLRFGAFLVVLAAIGPVSGALAARAVGAFALGQFVGRVAVFAPGGIGPREGATAVLLAPAIGGDAALVLVATVRLAEIAGEIGFVGAARWLAGGSAPGPARGS